VNEVMVEGGRQEGRRCNKFSENISFPDK